MFNLGDALTFSYPTVNRVRVLTKLQPRRVVVRSVWDLHEKPIESRWLKLRPNIRRGRYLLKTWDIDRQEHRQFYVDSMRSIRVCEMPLLRLGLYDPTADGVKPILFGPLFTDSRRDLDRVRDHLRQINQWLRESDRGQVVRLFPSRGVA